MLSTNPNCGDKSMIFMEYLQNPSIQNLNLVLQHIELPSNAEFLSVLWNNCNLDRKLYHHIGLVLTYLGRNCEAQYYFGLFAYDNKDNFRSWIYLSDVAAKRHDLGTLDYCIKKLIDLKTPDYLVNLEIIKQKLILGRNEEALEISLLLSDHNLDLRGVFILIDVVLRTDDQILLAKLNRNDEFPNCLEMLSKRENHKLVKMYRILLLNTITKLMRDI